MISDTNKFVKWRPDRPMCGCLLLCKEAEEYGEQLNLRGIINGVYAEAFPTILGPFVVHFEGTNLHGGDEIILAFYCLEDDQRLRGFKATVAAGCTPQAMCTMDLRVPELKVPRAGRYILTASHLGFVFAEAIFEVQTPHERVVSGRGLRRICYLHVDAPFDEPVTRLIVSIHIEYISLAAPACAQRLSA